MDILREVLEASPNAVLAVDEGGVIQKANRNVTDVFGYTPSEIEGAVVEDMLLEEDREHHVDYREAYMGDPEPRPMGQELDLYGLTKEGEAVPIEISLGPIRTDGDLYIIATIADISKRRERARELERQNARLDEFTSVVSHDLRNPLSVATGHLELVEQEVESEYLAVVDQALERMESLISELLSLAKAGRTVADLEPVALAAVSETCWSNVETANASVEISVTKTILADSNRVKQLLENLIRNAIEHGGDGVTVSVGEVSDGFYFEDDGPGIPEREREEIFDAGYTTSTDGTGFGLSIVQEIADAHGWTIRLTESDAGGARFVFADVEFVES